MADKAQAVERGVNLLRLQDKPVTSGDFAVAHLGYAIQRVTEPEARVAGKLHLQMLAVEGGLSDA